MAKRTGLDILNPIAREDPEGGMTVTLPECVRDDLNVMRWLHHRIGEVMADHGLVECLVHDVEMRLTTLSFDIVGDYVTGLVGEARASAITPRRPTPSAVDAAPTAGGEGHARRSPDGSRDLQDGRGLRSGPDRQDLHLAGHRG